MATLITLTVFYALALMVVILISFLVGAYILSLFTEELFTQGFYVLYPGMLFIVLGGAIDLIAVIAMTGVRVSLRSSIGRESAKETIRGWRTHYLIFPVLLVCSFIVAAAIVFKREEVVETFTLLLVSSGIIFAFYILKWQVIDIPAKALSQLGNEKGLKRARLSAIPLVVLLFSFLPLLASFRFEDAPTETIIVVYLEVLYASAILINLYCIGGLMKDLNVEIATWEKILELQAGSDRL
ncbi:MAG: hypothetical protein JXA22_03720 [Candidatus Thermoplasmatota archaeon]|nr:hypothetical protein [Candidatus Thermoplasmatota archaeon]